MNNFLDEKIVNYCDHSQFLLWPNWICIGAIFFHEVKEMYIYNTYIQYDDMAMTSTWHDSGDDKSIVNIIYDGDDDVDPIEFVYPLCLVESIFHCQTTFTRKSKPLPNNNSSRIHLSTWSKYLSTIKIICKQEPNYFIKITVLSILVLKLFFSNFVF